jgi:nitrilase
VLEPVVDEEGLFIAELDHRVVREERHNFDLAGHYSRPDVTRLVVNRARQSTVTFVGGTEPLRVLADLDEPVDMPGCA